MIDSARPMPCSLLEKEAMLQTSQPSRLDDAAPSAVSFSTEVEHSATDALAEAEPFDRELAAVIITRIESRLPGRICELTVYTTENAVILTGQCSTFYTKQVAQHAAMGVLEYEQLVNNIDVRTVK